MKLRIILVVGGVSSFLLLISMLGASFVSAKVALEVEYPSIPGIGQITPSVKLPQYVEYIYSLGMAIGFLAVFFALVYGGFLYVVSPVSPGKQESAKEWVLGGLTGLLVLVTAYLILNTISPEFTILGFADIDEIVPGIYLTGGGERKGAYGGVSDVANLDPVFTTIEYVCDNGPPVIASFYRKPNHPASSLYKEVELNCGETTPIEGQSFNFRFKDPGIYLYKTLNCSILGEPSEYLLSNTPDLENFDNQVKSVKVVNHPPSSYYGAILHSERNYEGRCLLIPPFPSNIGCSNNCASSNCGFDIVDYHPSSVTVFRYNPSPEGGGVAFYRKSFYDSEGGYLEIPNDQIDPFFESNLEALTYQNVPIEEKPCVQWDLKGHCTQRDTGPLTLEEGGISSIEIKGDYLVILYDSLSGEACQIFPTEDDVNKEGPKQIKWEYIRQDDKSPTSVLILPIK